MFRGRALAPKAVIGAGFLTLIVFAAIPASAQDCDRACLTRLITQYLDAVVAHDPSTLPLAERVKFTEDSKSMKLGEGLWKTVTGKGQFRQDYLDVPRQLAAAHLVLQEVVLLSNWNRQCRRSKMSGHYESTSQFDQR